ncbi:SRPBCC family protein [Reichenbachiella sp.]|uniref:SRPBCC family protein n=1 Tax=Reichenbachiella sp. TaxID=2184521 RepID=UPI003B5C076D
MRKVEVTLEINATTEQIIDAFINPDRLKDWWQVEQTLIEPKEGGVYTLVWQVSSQGFGYVSTGQISVYNPREELKIENFVYLNPEKPPFGPMNLTVRATPVDRGSVLYLCQDGYQTGKDWDWYYEAVKHAWPELLNTFKFYIES